MAVQQQREASSPGLNCILQKDLGSFGILRAFSEVQVVAHHRQNSSDGSPTATAAAAGVGSPSKAPQALLSATPLGFLMD